jgi:hypothetical protein
MLMIIPPTKVGDLLLCQRGKICIIFEVLQKQNKYGNLPVQWIAVSFKYNRIFPVISELVEDNFWDKIQHINPQDLILYSYLKKDQRYWELIK